MEAIYTLSVSVKYSLYLWQTVFICHRLSVSVTEKLCLSQTVCICHRLSLSITHSLYLSQADYVCHTSGHPLLAKLGPCGTDSPRFGMGRDCLWDSEEQHRKLTAQLISAPRFCMGRDCLWDSEGCVCHRYIVSVTYSLCLPQIVFVCHGQSFSATGSPCLSQTFFLII